MPHNNFNNFGQGPVGGMGGGSPFTGGMSGGNPFTSGGMFGPVGGPQNIGGGQGQMSDRELQELMQMYQSQGGGGGGELPNYNPALAGPTGVQPIDASGLGIDPRTAGMAPGGIGGMAPTGVGAITAGVDSIGDAAMYAWQQEQMEKRRLAQLMAAGGGMSGFGPAAGMGGATPGGGIPGSFA